jgi:hypothetical protein
MIRHGLLAEFPDEERLKEAAERVRDEGFRRWDCFSPYPVHGLDKAMGLKDTRLPWVVLGGGILGAGTAILMQWWMNAIDYPFVIGGKPLFSLPAQIPIAFELTVLFASIFCVLALLAFNRLPRFHHPAFRSARFRRVTTDRFFLLVEAADPRFDPVRTADLLGSLGASHVEWLED